MAPRYKPSDKKYAVRKHSIKRAFQRYKLRLDEDTYHRLSSTIKNSKNGVGEKTGIRAEYVEKQSNTRSLWKLHYLGKQMWVIYDKTRSLICTFLPKNLDPNEIQYKRWMFDDDSESA